MIQRTQLSEEQENTFDALQNFVKSNDRYYLVQGYAGCGKTTLMRFFVEWIEKYTKFTSTCTAPTNEAVRVLARSSGIDYNKTIYSLLGLQLVHEDDKEPQLKAKGESSLSTYDIIIVDEASMIHSELFQIIHDEMKKYSFVKMIFVGDIAQLPPVKDSHKVSPVFSIPNKSIMTTVQRTAKDNPIIQIVTDIRNNLDTKIDIFNRVNSVDANGHGVEFWDDRDTFLEEMYKDFTSEQYKNDDNYVKVAAYTNKAVNALNSNIRKRIFNKSDLKEYEVGEKLIVNQPILENMGKFSKLIFTIGERLIVKSVKENIDPEFDIKYWELKVKNYDASVKDMLNITIKVIKKESLKQYQARLSYLAISAREALINSKDRRRAWLPYFRFKEEWSWVKYNYGLTVHKLQGSTVERVYVIERDLNKLTWDDVERNKLKYVAFTRASKLLRIL